MATSVIAEAAVKIKPDSSGFEAQTTHSIGGTMAKIGGIIGGFAIGSKIFSAVKENVIGFNATLEQAHTAFTVLYGSSSKATDTINQLNTFAKETPFAFADLIPVSQQLVGALGKTTEVTPLLKELGDAVSATGGGADKLQQLTLGYTQMATSGKLNLGDLNQINTAVPGSLARMADAAGISIGQFRDKISKGTFDSAEAVKLFHKVTTDPKYGLAGGMEAQSKTFVGAMSNIQDAIQQMMAQAGKPIFEFVSKAAHAFGDFLAIWQGEDFATAIRKTFGGTAADVMQAFFNALSAGADIAKQAFDVMVAGLKIILPPLEEFIGFISDHIDIFGPLAIGIGIAAAAILGIAAAMVIATAAATAFGAVMAVAFAPITIIVISVGLLIGALILLYRNNEQARAIMDQAWGGIKETVMVTISILRATLSAFVQAAEAIWGVFGGVITSVAKVAFATLLGVVRGAFQILQGIFNVIGGILHGNWSQVWQGIKQIVSGALGIIVSILRGYIGVYAAIGRALIGGLSNAFQSGIQAIVHAAGGIAGKVKDAIGATGSLLYNAGRAIIQGLINGIGSMFTSLASKMKDAAKVVTDHLPGSRAKLGPLHDKPPEVAGAEIVRGLVGGMQSEAGNLAGMMGSLLGGSIGGSAGPAVAGAAVVINGPVHFTTTADSFDALQKDALNKQALRVKR